MVLTSQDRLDIISRRAEKTSKELERLIALFYKRHLSEPGLTDGDRMHLVKTQVSQDEKELIRDRNPGSAVEQVLRKPHVTQKDLLMAQVDDTIDAYYRTLDLKGLLPKDYASFVAERDKASKITRETARVSLDQSLNLGLPFAQNAVKRIFERLGKNLTGIAEKYLPLERITETKPQYYRFVVDKSEKSKLCKTCAQFDGKIFTSIEKAEKAGAKLPIHPNCRCRLEKEGQEDKQAIQNNQVLVSTDKGDNAEVDGISMAAPEISEDNYYAYLLEINKNEIEHLRNSLSMSDILFVDNMIYQYSFYFRDVPSADKILSALYIFKNYDFKTARKKLKKAGFTETYVFWTDYGEIGHIMLAYELAKNGQRSAKLDADYMKQRQAEMTALLAIVAGQLVNHLMTGPNFNPNTGYSDKSMLDQLEKNGYLNSHQRQEINNRWGLQTAAESKGKNIVGTNHSDLKPTQEVINPQKVTDYAKRLQAGEILPPVEVIEVPGKGIYIVEGHHRYVASQQTGIPIEIKVVQGQGPIGMPDWSRVQWREYISESQFWGD